MGKKLKMNYLVLKLEGKIELGMLIKNLEEFYDTTEEYGPPADYKWKHIAEILINCEYEE